MKNFRRNLRICLTATAIAASYAALLTACGTPPTLPTVSVSPTILQDVQLVLDGLKVLEPIVVSAGAKPGDVAVADTVIQVVETALSRARTGQITASQLSADVQDAVQKLGPIAGLNPNVQTGVLYVGAVVSAIADEVGQASPHASLAGEGDPRIKLLGWNARNRR